jgi:hypothetical protein
MPIGSGSALSRCAGRAKIRGVFLRVPHRRDGQRACRGSFVDPDYRKRMTIEDILAAVRQIAS